MLVTINLRHDRTDAEDKAVAQLATDNGMTYCRTCLDGCNHGANQGHYDDGGERGSCEHFGCWGPNGTNDCAGVAFAKVAHKL